jgi:hypothetical protein
MKVASSAKFTQKLFADAEIMALPFMILSFGVYAQNDDRLNRVITACSQRLAGQLDLYEVGVLSLPLLPRVPVPIGKS